MANLTRKDAEDFLQLLPQTGIRATTTCYPLREANQTLLDLRHGRLSGAAVRVM